MCADVFVSREDAETVMPNQMLTKLQTVLRRIERIQHRLQMRVTAHDAQQSTRFQNASRFTNPLHRKLCVLRARNIDVSGSHATRITTVHRLNRCAFDAKRRIAEYEIDTLVGQAFSRTNDAILIEKSIYKIIVVHFVCELFV